MPLDPIIAAGLLKTTVFGEFEAWIAEAEIAIGETIECPHNAWKYTAEGAFINLDSSYYPSALLPVSTYMYEIRDHTDAEVASLYDATAEKAYHRFLINTAQVYDSDNLGTALTTHTNYKWRSVSLVGDYIVGYSPSLSNMAIQKITKEEVPTTHTTQVAFSTTDPGSNYGWRVEWNALHSRLLVTRRDSGAGASLYQYEITDWDAGTVNEIVVTGESAAGVGAPDDLGENMATFGDWAVLAAPLEDTAGTDDGMLIVYKWDGVDRFEYKFYLTPDDSSLNGHFGRNVCDIHETSDGNVWIVGSCSRGQFVELWLVNSAETGATLQRKFLGGAQEDLQEGCFDHEDELLILADDDRGWIMIYEYSSAEEMWIETGYIDETVGEIDNYTTQRSAYHMRAARGLLAWSPVAGTSSWVKEITSTGTPTFNKVLDDDFVSDITGWTADNSATITNDTERLKITNGTSAAGIAKFAMTTVAGQNYLVRANVTLSDTSITVLADDTSTITGDLNTHTIAATGEIYLSFQAADTTTWLSFQNVNTTTGHVSYVDWVEVIPTMLDNAAFSDSGTTPWSLAPDWNHDTTNQQMNKGGLAVGDLTYDLTGFTWTEGEVLRIEVQASSGSGGGTSAFDVDVNGETAYAGINIANSGFTVHHIPIGSGTGPTTLRVDCNSTGAPIIDYIHCTVQTSPPTITNILAADDADTTLFGVSGVALVGDEYGGYYGGTMELDPFEYVELDRAGTVTEERVLWLGAADLDPSWLSPPLAEIETDKTVVTHSKYKAPTGGTQDYTAIRKA